MTIKDSRTVKKDTPETAKLSPAEMYLFPGDSEKSWVFPHHKDSGELDPAGVANAAKGLLSLPDFEFPKKAAARHLLKHYSELEHEQGNLQIPQPPRGLMDLKSYVCFEEAENELKMLTILCSNATGDGPDFFEGKGIFEEMPGIKAELATLPILGVSTKTVSREDLISRLESLTENKKESKKAFKQLKKLVKSKGIDAEVCEDRKTINVKAHGMKFTNVGKTKAEDYYADESDLNKINKGYTNMSLKPSDVYVFTLASANKDVDRQNEHFTEQALADMASLSLDKALLLDHDWATKSHIGKIFDSAVEDGILKQKVYINNKPKNQDHIDNILTGIFNKVSVGFAADMKDMLCDSCADGTSIFDMSCSHKAGGLDEYGKRTTVTISRVADYFETSIVPIPAQRDAGISQRAMTTKSVDTICSSLEDISSSQDPNHIPNEEKSVTDPTIQPSETSEVDESKAAQLSDPSSEMAGNALQQVTGAPTLDVGDTMDSKPNDVSAPRSEPHTPNTMKIPSKWRDASKKLRKAVKTLEALIVEQREFFEAQKAAAGDQSEKIVTLEAAQAETQKSLKGLASLVEAAASVTVENLEREIVAKKQLQSPRSVEGNKWAADLANNLWRK